MCFFGSLNSYSMRACLSIAITTMVSFASQETKNVNIDNTCSMYDLPIPLNSTHGVGTYDWNEELQVNFYL